MLPRLTEHFSALNPSTFTGSLQQGFWGHGIITIASSGRKRQCLKSNSPKGFASRAHQSDPNPRLPTTTCYKDKNTEGINSCMLFGKPIAKGTCRKCWLEEQKPISVVAAELTSLAVGEVRSGKAGPSGILGAMQHPAGPHRHPPGQRLNPFNLLQNSEAGTFGPCCSPPPTSLPSPSPVLSSQHGFKNLPLCSFPPH